MASLLHDLRYSLRSLGKDLGLTTAALLCTALGVGANSAIFSVVNGVLLRPLPYSDPQRLVWVWGTWGKDQGTDPLSDADFLDLRRQGTAFEGMAAFLQGDRTILGGEGSSESLLLSRVSAGYFGVLGLRPALGRGFSGEEERPGAPAVAILSRGLWARRYASDPRILGKTVRLDGVTYEVIGVMPPAFRDLADRPDLQPEIWLPLQLDSTMSRGMHRLQVIGRLKAGVRPAQAQSELRVVAARLERLYPDTNKGKGWWIQDLHEGIVGGTRRTLLILFGTVGMVLLISCANVANLLLARASSRRGEMAIRVALGAGRRRLLRQLLVESLTLGLLGGLLGLLLAVVATSFMVRAGTTILPLSDSVDLDLRVFGFTLAVSMLAGLLFGLLPAVGTSRVEAARSLQAVGRGSGAGVPSRRLREALVASEIALALGILVAAALLARSFLHLRSVDPGFQPEGLLVAQLSLPAAEYQEPARAADLYDRLLQRLRSLPDVSTAALADQPPFSPYLNCLGFEIEGRPPVPQEQAPCSELRKVGLEYFATLGIPRISGRLPDPKAAEAVINQLMARHLFAGKNPVGERVTFGGPAYTIVGVVGDTRTAALSYEPQMQVYAPLGPEPGLTLFITARGRSRPGQLIPALRSELRALDANLAFSSVQTMDTLLDRSVSSPRFRASLMGLFALLALLLAAIGIYGVTSYLVSRRRNEIGVRIALGACPPAVLRLVIWQGMRPVILGLVIGVLAAAGLTRLLKSLLFEISALDPWAYVLVPVFLALVALLACWLPARRATRIDPLLALRYE